MDIAGILSRLTGRTNKAAAETRGNGRRPGSPPLIAREGMRIHEVVVAGIQHAGRAEIVRLLTLDELLKFRRDPENEFDGNAVHILNSSEQPIGFLPRRYAAVIAPHLESGNLNIESKVVRLEQDPAGKTHAVHIAICLPDAIMSSSASPQLEYTCDRGSSGALYILLNCEPVLLNEIEIALTENGLPHTRSGPCTQLGSDGHEYNWFIRMEDALEEGLVHTFFKDNYGLQAWSAEHSDDIAEYAETFDAEIETKEQEINRLKTQLSQYEEQFREQEKIYKIEMAKARRETLQALLPAVELIRDSWDILLRELQNTESATQILQTIQIAPETLRAKRVETARSWMELHYGTGRSNDGRLYYKRTGQFVQVLLSFKREQNKDMKWLKKHD